MPGALDINASIAAPATSAGGAIRFGSSDSRANFIGAVGGSNGVSVQSILLLAAAAFAVWFFFFKKGGK